MSRFVNLAFSHKLESYENRSKYYFLSSRHVIKQYANMLHHDENSLPTLASVRKHCYLHDIFNSGDLYVVMLLLSPTVQKY
jgi:hypothetical protein